MRLNRYTIAICGATAWELQIGRVWLHLRHPRFWRTSGPGFIRNKEATSE